MIHALIHLLLAALFPPLLLGVIGRTKAVFAGRRGAPLLQPYHDLVKLLRKGTVLSRTTSPLFLLGPVIALAALVLCALLLPLGHHAPPLGFSGDAILFLYLLGLSRFFTALAALDTGSAFAGMGATREVSFACLAEPALFFGLLALGRLSGSLSLGHMLGAETPGWHLSPAAVVLTLAGFFIVLLAENSRIPFDDPNTHLELTMIHEVMVLDHSGPAFGMILYGAALKLFLFGALLLGALPALSVGDPWADWGVFLAGMLLLSVLIGVVESIMARLRLVNVPRLLVTACVLSGFAVVLLLK